MPGKKMNPMGSTIFRNLKVMKSHLEIPDNPGKGERIPCSPLSARTLSPDQVLPNHYQTIR